MVVPRRFEIFAILCSMFITAMPRPAPRSRPERSPSLHKRIQLAHKHGSLVAILPNGRICISHDSKDKNTMIKLWPYGGGYFRIQGEASSLYIAMNSKGIVYTTKLTNPETLFRHKMTPSLYHTFESEKYRGFFLGFKRRQGVPTKGKKTTFWKKAAHFLVVEQRLRVKETELQAKFRKIWEGTIANQSSYRA